MTDLEERVAQNESLFREVNERIDEVSEGFVVRDEPLADYVCECSDTDCTTAVRLLPDEYDAVRAESRHFLVAPGHLWNPEVERLIEKHDRYWVVEKVGVAGAVAEELEPES